MDGAGSIRLSLLASQGVTSLGTVCALDPYYRTDLESCRATAGIIDTLEDMEQYHKSQLNPLRLCQHFDAGLCSIPQLNPNGTYPGKNQATLAVQTI